MIVPTAESSGAPAPVPVNPSTVLAKDDFLRLLVTQLRHQDPLNPLDQNEFLAQTAQFTSLEQLQGINDQLSTLKETAGQSTLAEAAALLGRTVRSAGRDLTMGSGSTELPFIVESEVSQVVVEILDAEGKVVRQITTGPLGPGTHSVTWDGRDGVGQMLSPGSYFYRVSAPSADGRAAAALEGTVTGVERQGQELVYRLGDAYVREDDIIAVV